MPTGLAQSSSGGAGWTLDPFGGVVQDGKVYGRGACDMKGGLAASIIALEALIDSGTDLPGALEISGTVERGVRRFWRRALSGRARLAARRTDMPVVPSGARSSTLNINSIHGGQAEQQGGYPAVRAGLLPHGHRSAAAHRGIHGRGEGRGGGTARPHQPDEYVSIDDMATAAKVMALSAWSLLHPTA